jgi:hypothetical protein
MDITSCDRCGVVIDRDKIIFPGVYDHDSQEPIQGNSEWSEHLNELVAKVDCPVCKHPIFER